MIVRLSSMGDVIHTLPVARNAKLAGATVGWLIESRYAPLLAGNSDVDQTLAADTRRWRKRPLYPETVRDLRALRAALHHFAPDVTLDVQGLWRSSLLARLVGAPVIGFAARDRREPASAMICSTRIPVRGESLHVVEKNLLLLRKLGVSIAVLAPDARYLLRGSSPDADSFVATLPKPFALFHPGAGRLEKAWGEEHYSRLAERFQKEWNFSPVISWGPGDETRAARMAKMLPGAAVAPSLDYCGLARLAAASALFVGGDTGPLHLADALGVPTLSLFAAGVRNPSWRNGPYRGTAVTFDHTTTVEDVFARSERALHGQS